MIPLPCSLIECHLALESTCHVLMNTHRSTAVLGVKVGNSLIEVGKNTISNHGSFLLWLIHLLLLWFERAIHPSDFTIVLEQLEVEPSTEIICFAHALLVGSGVLILEIEVIQEEVDVANIIVMTEFARISEGQTTIQSCVNRATCHVIAVHIDTSNTTTTP